MTAHEAINLTPVTRLSRDAIRLERVLPGPPERVWAYLTEGDKRAQWFCGGSTLTKKGQNATLLFQHTNITAEPTPEKYKGMDDAPFKSEVTVLAWDPPRELAYTWPEGDDISEVTFSLSPQGNDTRLVLTHRRIGSNAYLISFSGGWHAHFSALAQVLEGEKPNGFWAEVAQLDAQYTKAFGNEPQ
ncbi:MAG: SRPBCC family protein [Mesorhizobium sp.]